jgi:hypothetical protein
MMGEDRGFRFLQIVSYARGVSNSSSGQAALAAPRRSRLPVDWLVAGLAVLLALVADRVVAPGAVCSTLVPSPADTGWADVVPLAVRDLGLPRDASVACFGIAAILALGFRPSLIGKLATAAVFLGVGLLVLVTFAYGIGIVSCR